MRLTTLALVCLLPAMLVGCDRPPVLVKVHGRVTVNGLPLPAGTVVFAPDEQRGVHGPLSYAVLDREGLFELATDNGPGAVAGWHRVTVAPAPESSYLIASLERYRNPDLSGLRFEVKQGQDNDFTIALTPDQ
jgi:hypothetical protein